MECDFAVAPRRWLATPLAAGHSTNRATRHETRANRCAPRQNAIVQSTVHFRDAGCTIATCGPLLAVVFREAATLDRLRAIREVARRLTLHHRSRTLSMTVLEPSATANVPKEVR